MSRVIIPDYGHEAFDDAVRAIAEAHDWPAILAEHRAAPAEKPLLDRLFNVGTVGEWRTWFVSAWQNGGRVYAEPGNTLFFCYPYDEAMNRLLAACGAHFRGGEVKGWVVRVTAQNADRLTQIAHTYHFCLHRDAEAVLRAALYPANKRAA